MRTQKKDKYIHIRISEDLKTKFDVYCEKKSILPSKLIRNYIKNILDEKDK